MIKRSVESPYPVDGPDPGFFDLSATWALTQQAHACVNALGENLELAGILSAGKFSEIIHVSRDLPTGVFFGYKVTFHPGVDLEFGIVDMPNNTIAQPWRIVCTAVHEASDGGVTITTGECMEYVFIRKRTHTYHSSSIALAVYSPAYEEVNGHVRLTVEDGPNGRIHTIATNQLSEIEIGDIDQRELGEALAQFYIPVKAFRTLAHERVRQLTQRITTGDFAAFSRHCNSTRQSTLSRIGLMLQ